MVSIAAFQAVDPGSIPGPRMFFFSLQPQNKHRKKKKNKIGGAGFRSLCLPIANRPLYRVSYTPKHEQQLEFMMQWVARRISEPTQLDTPITNLFVPNQLAWCTG